MQIPLFTVRSFALLTCTLVLPVSVAAQTTLSVTPNPVNVTAVSGASIPSKAVSVSKLGKGSAAWTVSTPTATWLGVSPTSGRNGGTLTLSFSSPPTTPGPYQASFIVQSSTAQPVTVTVNLTIQSGTTPPPPTITSLYTTGSTSVSMNQTPQYTAHANYSDGSSQVLTTGVWWYIYESTATIDHATGILTPVSAGAATVRFDYTPQGGSSTAATPYPISIVSATKTVTGLSIVGSSSVTVGQTAQYSASVTYSDGSSASMTTGPTWSTSSSSLATITQAGVLTAQAAGTVTVQAVLETKTAQLSVGLVNPPPTGSSVTIYVNPSGHDSDPGTASQPVRTIWVGVAKANQANLDGYDAIVSIAPGTYREAITIGALNTAKSLTLQGAGASTVLTGADDWSTGWTLQGDGTYTHPWQYKWGTKSIPTGWEDYWNWDGNGYKRNELLRSEMVYVNGSGLHGVLTQTGTASPGTFYVDETNGLLYMRLPVNVTLAGSLIEVGTRTTPLVVANRNNVTFRNFVVARNRGAIQEGMVNISFAQNMTWDGIQIRWAAYGGISSAYSSGLQILNSVFSDNGVNAIQSYQDVNILFQDSVISSNNWRGWADEHKGFDTVSKWSETRDVTIRRGQYVDNFGHGLWFDGDNHRILIDDVFSARNKMRGLYLELNPGPITVQDSKFCENGFEGVANARTDNLTINNNQIFDNTFWQITGTGAPTPVNLVDWQTGQTYTVYGGNMTLTFNVIRGKPLPAGQPLPNECYPGPACGWLFWAPDDNIYSYLAPTITSDYNQWYHSSTTQTYRVPTSKGNVVDFATFRTLMSQNKANEVHSLWSNSTALSCVP